MELRILDSSAPEGTARLLSLASREGLALIRDGQIIAHNSQFTDLVGATVSGRHSSIEECFEGADYGKIREMLAKAQPSFRDRVLCERDDGQWLEIRSREELPGMPLAVRALIVRDVTDEVLAEQELRRAKADLEQFAYVASHDLKSPLRGISNLASWIRDDLADRLEGQTIEYFDLLEGRIRRMETLLEDLLAYSRAGRRAEAIATVWLDELVEDVVELITPPEGFEIDIQCPRVRVKTTPTPLRTCLQNLVQNVFKHHDQTEGEVTIGVSFDEETHEIVVEVADDGPGIPPRFHEKIFAVFETLRPRDEVEGSGIGLALVRRLLEDVGGVIEVESPIENGRGTCFRMAWPTIPPSREDHD